MTKLKDGNEEPPKKYGPHWVEAFYRPPLSHAHLLSTGETWESLSTRYKRPVQALLTENFRTTNPYEVNWYLREYVKCDLATADRYNWRFSTSSRSGGGPRAGTIFIIPNWSSIGAAAKTATKALVKEWWHAARFAGAVTGQALTYGPNAITPGGIGVPLFNKMLQDGGAPDPLAERWITTLVDALGLFAGGLSATHSEAFPSWMSFPPGSLQPTPATPWLVLQAGGANYGVFGPGPMRTISLGFPFDGPGANSALMAYAQWLERAMQDLGTRLRATGVIGVGTVMPNRDVTGYAFGRGSCFSEATLVD